jgi:cytochrome c
MRAHIPLMLSGLILAVPALAADQPTPADAKAMLAKAVAFYKEHGRKAAFEAFNKNAPPFSDRGLYVFCIGPDRTLVADGEFRSFIGQSADIIKDATGRKLGEALWDAARNEEPGEVHYQFLDPATQKMKPKVSFVERVDQDVCGVGTYETK